MHYASWTERAVLTLLLAVSLGLFWWRFRKVVDVIRRARATPDFQLAPIGPRIREFLWEVMLQGKVIQQRPLPGLAHARLVLTDGLFRVHSVKSDKRPPNAHVAVPYKGHWFYIDETDQDTKSTFSLLVELSRLELAGKAGPGPVLTLPVGGR